jgi:cytochrome P450
MNVAFENMVAASMSRIRLRIPGLEFNRGLEGRDFMVRMLSSMLAATREGSNTDMFSLLSRARTEDGDSLGDADVIDHMIFLMMAAHDTTTSTLSSVVYELAAHPEWQERVREECLGAAEQPSFDGLDELTGLTWVMREALRLYPPLPVIPRVATRDCEFGGFRIPADTMVIVSPIHTHRMPEWWSDPGRFDPERFSPLRAEDRRHTHNWVPFGGGAHMCIGRLFAEAQVRLILHHMVRRYRWSIPDGYVMPVQQAPISKPRDGLPIELKPI